LTELLPFIIYKKENKLTDLLNSLRRNLLIIDWQEIQNIQILNLIHGNNAIGISDIIIAQNCIQNESKLITNDKHFKVMAKYIPLKLYK
jgi:predicted nucleic acid-binding protein